MVNPCRPFYPPQKTPRYNPAMRFTLRDLFWLTLLVAVCCVQWLTYRAALKAARERDEAVRAWALGIRDDPPIAAFEEMQSSDEK
jgi:hypothetical protein